MVVTTLEPQKSSITLHTTLDSFLLVSENGSIHHVNSNVEEMFGFDAFYLYENSISYLFPKIISNKIKTYIYRCYNDLNFTMDTNLFGKNRNGEIFPVEIYLEAYNFGGDHYVLLKVSSQNNAHLSIEKEMMQELFNTKRIHKKQIDFISKTSHELRTPLTTILNASTILNKLKGNSINNSMQDKNIDRIQSAVEKLTNILDDFLTINKIEDKESNYSCDVLLAKYTKGIINNLTEGNKKQIHITYKSIGDSVICIDKEMLSSILNNLLSNAIKYSPSNSTINLDTMVINNVLTIICKDRGIGIPIKDKTKLFQRYYRANNAINIQGTGLGLNIIKEYVSKIGGNISFKSKLNRGTTFTVTIPLKQNSNQMINNIL